MQSTEADEVHCIELWAAGAAEWWGPNLEPHLGALLERGSMLEAQQAQLLLQRLGCAVCKMLQAAAHWPRQGNIKVWACPAAHIQLCQGQLVLPHLHNSSTLH